MSLAVFQNAETARRQKRLVIRIKHVSTTPLLKVNAETSATDSLLEIKCSSI